MRVWIAVTLLFAAIVLLRLGVEPVSTWFYVFAWYPILVIAHTAIRGSDDDPLWSRGRVASLFGWSIPIWMVYEIINFRIRNWYYVSVPNPLLERWFGIAISFATVLPAIVVAERVLRRSAVGPRPASYTIELKTKHLAVITSGGAAMLGLALWSPEYFSPLIWVALFLLLDPLVFRRLPECSLIADMSTGRWTRVIHLALGGLLVGLAWETLNYWAGAKWIYTVPLLEATKWFEMPPLGFLGFLPFALSAWSAYHGLCAVGLAFPMERSSHQISFANVSLIAPLAAIFVVFTLRMMDTQTISSTKPLLTTVFDDPLTQESLTAAGYSSPFELAAAAASTVAKQLGVADSTAERLVESSRIATLRGIGGEHTRELARAGIHSVCQLAAEDPQQLWLTVHALFRGLGPRPTRPEVTVWVRAAQRNCREIDVSARRGRARESAPVLV